MTIANRDQAEHWNNSDDVAHWVNEQARYDGMLAPFITVLLERAGVAATDRVLDVGCGCGATTLAAAQIARDGHAHGVDISHPMLVRARADAAQAGLTNATFEEADVQVHPFPGDEFDAVISRFGIMFFDDPVAAFVNLRRITRPGGQLAFVCWQARVANEWMTVPTSALIRHVPPPPAAPPGAPGMCAFADPDDPRRVLDDAGWQDITIDSLSIPLLLGGPGTVDTAVDFLRNGSMGRTMLTGADPATQAKALDEVRTSLEPYLTSDGVRLGSSVWLVSARG
jgi:SAM-dependent methyltransferase